VVVIDLWPSQRETSEIGTPLASAVLAKVMPQIVERGVLGEPAATMAGFQRAQAALVAAIAQPGVERLGAADSLVPPLAQPGLVRAEQARPGQPGAAGQLIGGRRGGVPADRLGIEP